MSTQQIQKKPTVAYILSLLGGIFGLLLTLLVTAAFLMEAVTVTTWGTYAITIWMLIASLLIIFFARKLNANPTEHSKWGALIFAFSIASIFGLFAIIGGIAALVYNPMPSPRYTPPPQTYVSTVYTPPQQQYSHPQPPPAYTPQIVREKETIIKEVVMIPCKYCGALSPQLSTFCPNCGAKRSI